jgi:hypothetical protein
MLMRIVFLIIFLIGAAVGFAYPWVGRNLAGHEIGTWRVKDGTADFRAVDAQLGSADAPVEAYVDMTASMRGPVEGQSVLTITAATQGRTVLARSLDLSEAEKLEESPQSLNQVWRLPAGTISEVEDGVYTFTVGTGDAEGVELRSVDLRLRGGGAAFDERAQPIGFSLMAVGFIGFMMSFRRARGNGDGGQQPPKPRWGRGAAGGA